MKIDVKELERDFERQLDIIHKEWKFFYWTWNNWEKIFLVSEYSLND